jgi:hypothetical protein
MPWSAPCLLLPQHPSAVILTHSTDTNCALSLQPWLATAITTASYSFHFANMDLNFIANSFVRFLQHEGHSVDVTRTEDVLSREEAAQQL